MTSEGKPSWDELEEQASLWLARLDSGTASREEFEAWRSADTRHAVAFAQAAHVLQQLDRVKPAYKLREKDVKTSSRRHLLLALGGLGAAVSVGGGAYLAMGGGRSHASTQIGQRQTLALPAGVSASLNTDSRMQWAGAKDRVDVWLRRGELLLASGVAPVRLFAADSVVTLVRGKINARLRGGLLDLTVLSGDCTVNRDNAGSEKKATISANQAVLASADQQVVRSLDQSDIRFVSAWPKDELVFEGQTLGTAVAEYNRYLNQKIVITDPSLSDLRIGGRFTTRDAKPFLDALHAGFGINAVTDGAGTIALSK
ncbi:FecR family protein [Asticcacaulis sp.]|uniref:FecR family protein n=1 Tax=Asticcacaulis sp. TaxID=1872648 RepID=UPI003F7CB796